MTVSTTTNKVRINGNGITTSFPFQFPILKNDFSDLKVYRIDIDEETQEETATLLSITTNYTITVIKNLEQRITSGYINLINENNEPLALTENQALFIMREEEITQDLDLYENQKFPYKNLENILDKIIVINQQQQEQIDRTLKTSSFFTGSLSETITSPVENRSLKWKKKQDGTFYVSNSDTDVDEVYNQTVNNPNVIAVGQNINNVNINANNIHNVNTTANNINNINTTANNIDNVNIITNSIENINISANNINSINANANNIDNINTTANNINNVNTLATNIATIQTKANTNLNNIDTTAKETEVPLEELKQEKIKELKQNCQDYIYSVYPIYKQMNIINPLSDYSNEDRIAMNAFLDKQRAICNEKEKQINEAESREKLNMIVIDFEKVES